MRHYDKDFADTLRRLLAIIAEIRAGGFPNKDGLAELTGFNRRTIQRDLRLLREDFGAPIAYDRQRRGFYFTDRHWRLDK